MFYLKKNPFIIRKISTTEKEIFLTFDDGPDADLTDQILDLLKSEDWKASFFVIGEQAQKQKKLIQKMIQEGHSVMSHSFDHRYSHYFRGKNHIKKWIQDSLEDLSLTTQVQQKVFRPPAGILTPPLLEAAQDIQVPLILWNHRFYDTAYAFTPEKAQANLKKLKAGDIVLLHDRQRPERRKLFLSSLRHYIQKMKQSGYTGSSLSHDSIFQEIRACQ